MRKQYSIKVTGSGTRSQIISALHVLVKSLETCDEPLDTRAVETFEDETLYTELTEE